MEINVALPDGSIRRYARGTTISQVAASISTSLTKNAAAGKIDGRLVDFHQQMDHDCNVEIVMADSRDGLFIQRHSTAHLMAQAIQRIYGSSKVKLGIGPVIEDGFYYEIGMDGPLSTDELAGM
ncbi:hypothetical protein AMQ83_10685 [Paenibacillus riograndensis]|nr:hypothetical protein AMQ83_10685 [Paenibacillus riograndensis]